MPCLVALVAGLGITGAAASEAEIRILRERVAELEAQAEADAGTIERLRAERDARLSETDGELLRSRILNLTQSLATVRAARDRCDQDRRTAAADLRRLRSSEQDLRLRLRQTGSQLRTAENRARDAASDASRARSEVQRLRSDLRRCR